jgi:O-acetylserine/cysteine efflux transporter
VAKAKVAMTPAHLALALLIDLLWGLNSVVAKIGVDAVPPMMFMALRFVLVLALLFPFLKWKRGEIGAILAIAVTGGLLNFAFAFWGLRLSNASLSSIIGQLNAPFATLLSIVFLKEVVHWRRWLGMALAFGGVVYMSFDPEVLNVQTGAILTVIPAIAMSVAQVQMRRLKDVGVFELQAWIALVCAPGLFLGSLVFERGQWASLQSATWPIWGAVVYNALAAGIIGQGGMYFLLRRHNVALVTSLFLIAPVFAVVFGVWLLGEPMSARIIAGSVVTLIGVFIIALRQGRAAIVAVTPGQGAIEPAPGFDVEGRPHAQTEPAPKH